MTIKIFMATRMQGMNAEFITFFKGWLSCCANCKNIFATTRLENVHPGLDDA